MSLNWEDKKEGVVKETLNVLADPDLERAGLPRVEVYEKLNQERNEPADLCSLALG